MYFITRVPDGVIGNTTGFGPVILGSSPNQVTIACEADKEWHSIILDAGYGGM